jgi:molybdopterin-guanine dinucleotide biosynthesis protein B
MIPVVSFVGKSNSGKTTVIEKLLPVLKARGLKVAVVKHALHGFEIDRRGKDSYRHKAAGADTVIVVSGSGMAVVKDESFQGLGSLQPYLAGIDLVITEGFKKEETPKIEVLRSGRGGPFLCTDDRNLIARVTDLAVSPVVPVFGLDNSEALADFIVERVLVDRANS